MGMGEPLANLDALLPALAEARRDGWTRHQSSPDHDLDGRAAEADQRLAEARPAIDWPSRCTPPTTSSAAARADRRKESLADILAAADHYFDPPAGD